MTRARLAALLALSLTAWLADARGGQPSENALLSDLTAFAIARPDSLATPVSVETAAAALKDFDVIFLGEWHDHPGNHVAEMALFRAIHAYAPALTLSLEQFERDVQNVLDDYMAGRIGEEALKRRGRAWSNYPEAYRPLVEYAKEQALPVIAANAPAAVVRCVGQEGPEMLARLNPERRSWAAAELHLFDGPYKDKFLRFLAEDRIHGDPEPGDRTAGPSAADLRSFAAQVTRDDTMAESIFLHLRKNPGRKVVHVTGAFHVAGGLGTVERLRLRAPDLKIAVLVPLSTGPQERAEAEDTKGADFVLLLKPLPRRYVSEAEEEAARAELGRTFRSRGQCQL